MPMLVATPYFPLTCSGVQNWSVAGLDVKNHIRGSDSGAAGVFGSETRLWFARLVRAREAGTRSCPLGRARESRALPRNCFRVCRQLKSSRLAVKWWSVECDGPAILESDFELYFENRFGGFCFAVDAYRWFF
jgi:hypothetical protein